MTRRIGEKQVKTFNNPIHLTLSGHTHGAQMGDQTNLRIEYAFVFLITNRKCNHLFSLFYNNHNMKHMLFLAL